MHRDFAVIDLTSQASAVNRYWAGMSPEKKIAWLAKHGSVTSIPTAGFSEVQSFCFESHAGQRCVFALCGDELLLLGEHHWIVVGNSGSD